MKRASLQSLGGRALALFVLALLLIASACNDDRSVVVADAPDSEAPLPPLPPPTDASPAEDAAMGICPTLECPAGRATCSGTAFPCGVDLRTDENNCGSCGNRCPSLMPCPLWENVTVDSIPRCAKTWPCVDGVCKEKCPPGYADCNGYIEDGCETEIGSDPNNCGSCNKHCDVPLCQSGKCGCEKEETWCAAESRCINLDKDNLNCGACGRACPPPAPESMPPPHWHATRRCIAGSCNELTCQGGWGDCNGDFGDPAGDGCETELYNEDPTVLENCGRCGNNCSTGQLCMSGECRCSAPFTLCGGRCFDLTSDIDNCGECFNRCPGDRRSLDPFLPVDRTHGFPICENGRCGYKCIIGWSNCDDDVESGCESNVLDDPKNCGRCGAACTGADGQPCVNGACLTKPCPVQ